MSSDKSQARRRNALVTGAAARIGAAIAETLHERGCTVAVHCNSNRDGAEALVERLNRQRAELKSEIESLEWSWLEASEALEHASARS